MTFEHLDTGTAADLLNYQFYTDASGAQRLERVATSDQQWIVQDWDGERYVIKFANNFSKKHIYTMTKREDEVREAAYYAWENAGKTGDTSDHWRSGEHERLDNKLETASRSRIKANTTSRCSYCGHAGTNHAGYNAGTRTGGVCSTGGCGCTQFYRYEDIRTAMGKTIASPLTGAETKRNTCIVMNWVPKSEFETVVCKSIQAVEKPSGWAKRDPLAKAVGDTFHLRWDFGPARMGAVVHVDLRPTAVQTFTQFQGCEVSARKTHTDWGVQTYEIYHFVGQF
ncbi:MAG: DUF2934 domain-containing protein [Paracoccaceae bacterium]